jgi:membrane protein DedA with SNARE-associated domain
MIGVVVAVAIGVWIASIALYFVGRWRIDWVRRQWPEKHRLLDAALAIVERHPWRASLAVRFAYGLRLPLPIACGAARVPLGLYTIASGISSWLWSMGFVYVGYIFGGAAVAALRFTDRIEVKLGVAAFMLFLLLVYLVRRRFIAERTARLLAGKDVVLPDLTERRPPEQPSGTT